MTRIIEVFRLLGSVFIADPDNPSYKLKVNSDGSTNFVGSVTASLGAFNPKGKATLAVSNATARVALPTADTGLVLRNSGATDAYFALGSVTVNATTGSFLIKAGDIFGLDASGSTYIAGITAASTTTFEIWTGTGLISAAQAGGSGSGGGAVTIADGAAVTIGAVADAAYTSGSGTLVAVLKGLYTKLGAVVLAAGSALVGKVGIDQTTPGLTNAVSATNLPATVDAGSGATSASTIRVRLTTDDLATLGIGGVADTAWVSGSGSIIAVLKGVFGKIALMVFGAGTAAAAQRVTLASDDPAVATLGATSGAAVITDANGTIQQYLRGIIKQLIAGTILTNPTGETPVLKSGLTNSASSVISSQAATLKSYYCYNPNATVEYVQFFDVAAAGSVTVGTTVPKWSIGIPATSAANLANLNIAFTNGIQVAATTAAGNATAPGTALDCNFSYR